MRWGCPYSRLFLARGPARSKLHSCRSGSVIGLLVLYLFTLFPCGRPVNYLIENSGVFFKNENLSSEPVAAPENKTPGNLPGNYLFAINSCIAARKGSHLRTPDHIPTPLIPRNFCTVRKSNVQKERFSQLETGGGSSVSRLSSLGLLDDCHRRGLGQPKIKIQLKGHNHSVEVSQDLALLKPIVKLDKNSRIPRW